MSEIIANKVNQSGLIQLDLETLRIPGDRIFFDLKPHLFMGMVLKEKDFRAFIGSHDWEVYQGKHVAIGCSEDVIIPTWAFMLVSIELTPFAKTIAFGNLNFLENLLYEHAIQSLDMTPFVNGRVVIKGCSKDAVPTQAYVQIVHLLKPFVKSLFFGEPCSTVPLYKNKNISIS